jgi:hypothetical protein
MTRQDAAALTARWLVAGPVLENIRRRELQQMTVAQRRAIIARLFSGAVPASKNRSHTSGLIEQQRLFARSRDRQNEPGA